MSDGFLHQRVVNDQWEAVVAALGATVPEHAGWSMVWFVVFEAGRGFLTMYTYVLLRPRLGPGVKTATWAGVVAWVAYSLTGPAQFIPLGFYSENLWFTVAVVPARVLDRRRDHGRGAVRRESGRALMRAGLAAAGISACRAARARPGAHAGH